jgi:hypothetical protein
MRRLSELIGATTLDAYADLGNLIANERPARYAPSRLGIDETRFQVLHTRHVRPGAKPSKDPGPSREQSTKDVSYGSDRFQVIPSRIQRTALRRILSHIAVTRPQRLAA